MIQDSTNPVELLKSPNAFAVKVYGAVLFLVFLLVVTMLYVIGKCRQRRMENE